MERSSELFVRELTHILVTMGALSGQEEKPLDHAFGKSSYERYDMFLLDEGLVFPEHLLKALSILYRVPSFDVTDYFFQHNMLHQFPKEFLLRNAIIPAEQEDEILLIVAANPADSDLLVKIGTHVSYDIQFAVGIYQDIIDAIEEFYDRSITEKDEDGDDMDGSEYELDTSDVVVDSDMEE